VGNYSRAVALLEKYIAVDPYEEDVYCRMIRWHLEERNKALALRIYKQYVEFANNESKSESSHEIRKLYQLIVAGGPSSYIQN
jgi:DNA-binding SARP family transcriptional activator